MATYNINSDLVFTNSSQDYAKRENTALRSLQAGLGQFTTKQYELAITSFKRAISAAPLSDAALNAYDYMARTYLTQGDTEAAIDTYTKALKIAPNRDDMHVQLGNIYTTAGRFDEARDQYALAVKYNPSAPNRYSLGQGYMGAGQYDEAIQQFERVQQQQPSEPFGYHGLGQAYAKQGRYEDAIAAFKQAIGVQYDYKDSYSEMGYVYVDSGDPGQAQEIVDTLKGLSPTDTTLADSLTQYIYEKTQPKMTSAYASSLYSPFLSTLGPSTPLTGLSSYLATASAEQTFAMEFQFNKPMDAASVQDVFNWNITRASGTGRADGYNYDMSLPATEVTLSATPQAVYYNGATQTATVLFNIRQNATADGTLDPSHINFTFNGKDLLGLSIDKSADMYSGFSGFA